MSNSARKIEKVDQNSGQLILKILSGAYSGAELSLDGSEYILGSALECDIAIEDASLAPNHFKIVLGSTKAGGPAITIQILSTMLSVSHNNRKIENISFEMRPCDRVQVGEFIFGIGPAEGTWIPYEEVLERDRQEEEAAKKAAEEELKAELAKKAEAEQKEKEEQEKLAAAAQAKEEEEAEEEANDEEGEAPKSKKQAIENEEDEAVDDDEYEDDDEEESSGGSKAVILGSVAAAVLLTLSITLFFTLDSGEPVAVVSTAPTGNALTNSPLSPGNIQQHKNTRGQQNFMVDSNILSNSDQAVWQPTAEELALLERAKKSIRSMFDAFKFNHLRVEKGTEPLTVIVRGYTDRIDEWRKVKGLIDRDIGGLNQVLDYVETPWSRKKQLEQMLVDRGLGEETQVFMTPQGLLVKTSLSARDEQRWSRVEEDYQSLYENNPPLFRIKDTAPWLDIKSVNFGYEPYLVTSDGTKYLVGAHVKNGYILDKITPEGVVLKNDGLIKNLPLP